MSYNATFALSHLNGTRKDMPIVRCASGKRRSVIESVFWATFRQLYAGFERFHFSPVLENFLFRTWEVEFLWH